MKRLLVGIILGIAVALYGQKGLARYKEMFAQGFTGATKPPHDESTQ